MIYVTDPEVVALVHSFRRARLRPLVLRRKAGRRVTGRLRLARLRFFLALEALCG